LKTLKTILQVENGVDAKRLFFFLMLNRITKSTSVIILSLPLEEIKITNQRLQETMIRITNAGYTKRLHFLLNFFTFFIFNFTFSQNVSFSF